MNTGRGQGGARTFALACVLLVSGACFGGKRSIDERMGDHLEAARARVREEVDEPERAQQILTRLDGIEALLREQRESQAALTVKLQALNADPATATAGLQGEFDAFLAERRARRSRLLDLHFEIRGIAQPDEWASLVDAELKAMSLGSGVGEK